LGLEEEQETGKEDRTRYVNHLHRIEAVRHISGEDHGTELGHQRLGCLKKGKKVTRKRGLKKGTSCAVVNGKPIRGGTQVLGSERGKGSSMKRVVD